MSLGRCLERAECLHQVIGDDLYIRDGVIAVAFGPSGRHDLELVVADDGIGISDHIDMDDPPSFGLKLVHILVDQLGGEIEVRRGDGSKFRVTFTPDSEHLQSD